MQHGYYMCLFLLGYLQSLLQFYLSELKTSLVTVTCLIWVFFQSSGAVVTESQTYKKRADFLSNDDYAVYVRENIQVSMMIKSSIVGLSFWYKSLCMAMADRKSVV